ncbi:MFS transporter [Streptomyces sp. NPDC004031]
MLAGVVLVAMSISGTAVALPDVGRDLGTSGPALNWVVAGYNLAFAAMTLVAGSAADRMGRRRTFLVSALVFSCGFLVTAVSPSIVITDVSRIVSGAGGAGVMAAGGALLASSYQGAARNRAFALMGTMAGVGIAAGPTLSGLLISPNGQSCPRPRRSRDRRPAVSPPGRPDVAHPPARHLRAPHPPAPRPSSQHATSTPSPEHTHFVRATEKWFDGTTTQHPLGRREGAPAAQGVQGAVRVRARR